VTAFAYATYGPVTTTVPAAVFTHLPAGSAARFRWHGRERPYDLVVTVVGYVPVQSWWCAVLRLPPGVRPEAVVGYSCTILVDGEPHAIASYDLLTPLPI
jgi:hypothetical protein